MDGETEQKEPTLYEYTIVREDVELPPKKVVGNRHEVTERSGYFMLTIYNDRTGEMYVTHPGRWVDFSRMSAMKESQETQIGEAARLKNKRRGHSSWALG